MNDEVSALFDKMRPMPTFECLHACKKRHDIVLLADNVNWQSKNDRSCRLEVFFHPFLYSQALQGVSTKLNVSQACMQIGQVCSIRANSACCSFSPRYSSKSPLDSVTSDHNFYHYGQPKAQGRYEPASCSQQKAPNFPDRKR
jgi:hypothetical protein